MFLPYPRGHGIRGQSVKVASSSSRSRFLEEVKTHCCTLSCTEHCICQELCRSRTVQEPLSAISPHPKERNIHVIFWVLMEESPKIYPYRSLLAGQRDMEIRFWIKFTFPQRSPCKIIGTKVSFCSDRQATRLWKWEGQQLAKEPTIIKRLHLSEVHLQGVIPYHGMQLIWKPML